MYIKNVILKGEVDEVAATMPELAQKLQILQKVYESYIAELVTTASQLQQDFALEEGKGRRGKWARACQALPKCLFNPLMRCWSEEKPLDDTWFRIHLFDAYETSSGKIVGDMVLQQVMPRYASQDEAKVLMADIRSDMLVEGVQTLSISSCQ